MYYCPKLTKVMNKTMKKLSFSILILCLFWSCNAPHKELVKIEGKQLPVNDSIIGIQAITDSITPYKVKVEKEMNTQISYTPVDITRLDGDLESSLGNLMADICYEKSNMVFETRTDKNVDFAMFNYGGIRAGITAGPITNLNAFKLMPFENSLVIVELTSEKIEELAHYLMKGNKAHPLSKEIQLTLEGDKYTLKINGKSIDKNKTYYVATSDYLQSGGDNMNFFKNPVSLFKTDYKVRNALIDYFKEHDTIDVALDGRFIRLN